jgi:heme/copper-type cytochrome/quinol oxidase subunit 1
MLLAAFFLFVAVIYFILMKMQRRLHKGLSLFHYIMTVVAILTLFFGMVFSGFFTTSESLDVNAVLFDFKRLNKAIAVSAFLLIFSQLVFIINCLFGIFNVKILRG